MNSFANCGALRKFCEMSGPAPDVVQRLECSESRGLNAEFGCLPFNSVIAAERFFWSDKFSGFCPAARGLTPTRARR